MNLPRVVSSEEWQAAREMLLAKEKEATRARDALAAERRRLPIVRIDNRYERPSVDENQALLRRFLSRAVKRRPVCSERFGSPPRTMPIRSRIASWGDVTGSWRSAQAAIA